MLHGRIRPRLRGLGMVTSHLGTAPIPSLVLREGGCAHRRNVHTETRQAGSEMTSSRWALRPPPPAPPPRKAPPPPTGSTPALQTPPPIRPSPQAPPHGPQPWQTQPATHPERGAGGRRSPSWVSPAGRGRRAAMAEAAPQHLALPSGLLELCALLGAPRDSLRGPDQVRIPRGN